MNTAPLAPNTPEGMLALQRDMIRMLEAALKIYAPNDPALIKLAEVRQAFKTKKV